MAVLFTLLVRCKPCQSTLPLVSHTYSSSPLQNLVVFLTRKWRLTTFTRSFTNMMFRHQDRSLRLHSRHVPTMAVILILDSTPWVRPWHSPTQLPPTPLHPPTPLEAKSKSLQRPKRLHGTQLCYHLLHLLPSPSQIPLQLCWPPGYPCSSTWVLGLTIPFTQKVVFPLIN